MNPVEFLAQLFTAKTRVLGLSVGEDYIILACILLTQHQHECDRLADRQTDIPIISNTSLCIASYADALQKLMPDMLVWKPYRYLVAYSSQNDSPSTMVCYMG